MEKKLLAILQTNDSGYIRRRESSILEFKANFNLGQLSNYAKTMAAFANNHGGAIAFGITDNPRLPQGLSNDKFFTFDPEKITNELNRTFQPEISWKMEEIEIDSKKFGFIIVDESSRKPVIAKTNKGNVKEGGIYYRYNARSELIKYPELLNIIETIKKKERRLWLNHIQQIAHIGVESAGIFNPTDGLVKGSSGAFIIDKTLLPHLQFIKEGHFVEKDGSPSIKLIGNAHVIGTDDEDLDGIIGIQEKAINQNDIIVNFLSQIKVRSPQEYLKQICLESTKYLPFYYYCNLANIRLKKFNSFLQNIQGYNQILSRLSSDSFQLSSILRNTGTTAYNEKKNFKNQLINGNLQMPNDRIRLLYLLSVLRSLQNVDIIRETLLEIYKKPIRKIGVIADFRLAVCYLDYLENKF